MHSEDRLIHFSIELIHQPGPLKVPALQKLYYDLSQTRAAYDSIDVSAPGRGRFYSRRGKKTQSLAVFLPDRVAVIEEWLDTALSDCFTKVQEIIPRALEALEVPGFVAQTATLRSTFALTHFDDARVFLMDHACQQAERIAPHFQRPVSVGGLRFVLPETPEHPGNLHVNIESFRFDPKEVFVEVKGVFGKKPIGPDDIDDAIENVRLVRAFISDHVFPYLNQYDSPQEGVL